MDSQAFVRLHLATVFYGSAGVVGVLLSLFAVAQRAPAQEPALTWIGDRYCLDGDTGFTLDSPLPAGCLPPR